MEDTTNLEIRLFLVDIGIIIALAGAERSDERSDFPWS